MDYEEFNASLKEATDFIGPWHKMATSNFSFVAGDQWQEEARSSMKEQRRPALVYNQTKPIIDAVAGSEVVNRFEAKFLPRSASLSDVDSVVAEALGEVYKSIRQHSSMEHHESRAYHDTLTAGVGCTETYVDYEASPNGRIITRWTPVRQVAWDPKAQEQNLTDAGYIIRAHWLSEDHFNFLFPGYEEVVSDIKNPGLEFFGGFAGVSRVGDDYQIRPENSLATSFYDFRRKRILVYEIQYFERVRHLRAFIGDSPVWVRPEEKDEFVRVLVEGGMDEGTALSSLVELPRRLYRRAMITGREILQDDDLIVDDFTYKFITGYPDQSDESYMNWVGLVESLKDPQQMVNKLLSQILYFLTINPNALVAEEGVFVNKEQAEQDISDPNKIVEVTRGAIKDGRMVPRLNRSPIPSGMGDLLAFSLDAMPRTSGVNPFFLGSGINDLRRTPASSIQSVQRQAMVILSVLMDSLRYYRKNHATMIVKFIQKVMTSDMVERIITPEIREVNQMRTADLIMSTEVTETDIVVDEAPTTPNAQSELRSDLLQSGLLQALIGAGIPLPPKLFDYLGLPSTVAKEMQGLYQSMLQGAASQQPTQNPPQ